MPQPPTEEPSAAGKIQDHAVGRNNSSPNVVFNGLATGIQMSSITYGHIHFVFGIVGRPPIYRFWKPNILVESFQFGLV
jgi:hypothetical protein